MNNRVAGRLHEVRVERKGDSWVVTQYVLGPIGLFERLQLSIFLLVGHVRRPSVARWDQVDISDPERPRLRCSLEELAQA
jgi:hypothetical protein